MDTRLQSVSLLTLILLAPLFTSFLSVSEAPPLSKHGTIGEVNGVFRTLKSSGPSPGIGHRVKKLQNLGYITESGPSPGIGHRLQKLGHIAQAGPSPGIGHRLNKLQNLGERKDSGPSPGGGGH